MIKIGDRVEQRDFVGHHGKRGQVIASKGDLVTIRWDDGHESSLIPGPGALQILEPKKRSRS